MYFRLFSTTALLLLKSAVFTAAQDRIYNGVDSYEFSSAVDPFDFIRSLEPNLNDLTEANTVNEADSASIDSAAGSNQPNFNPFLGGQINFNEVFANNRLASSSTSSSSNRYSQQIVSTHNHPSGDAVVEHHKHGVSSSSSSTRPSSTGESRPRHIPNKYSEALAIDDFWYNFMAQTYQHVDVDILVDDSGSMCFNYDGKSYENVRGEIAPYQRPSNCKRWKEAIEWLDIMLAAIQIATYGEKKSTVSFLNSHAVFKDVVYGNEGYRRLMHHVSNLRERDFGETPSGAAMERIFKGHENRHDGKPYPLVVYFITDGDPSDASLFDNVVKRKPSYYFVAIRATTNRERDIAHLNMLDKTVANFDVSDDYLDEKKEIVYKYQEMFDYPRYVLKFLMAPFVSELDLLDEAISKEMDTKVSYSYSRSKRQNLQKLRTQVVQAIDWKHKSNYHPPQTADLLDAAVSNNKALIRAKSTHSSSSYFGK